MLLNPFIVHSNLKTNCESTIREILDLSRSCLFSYVALTNLIRQINIINPSTLR